MRRGGAHPERQADIRNVSNQNAKGSDVIRIHSPRQLYSWRFRLRCSLLPLVVLTAISPALAEAVTFAELDGAVIEVTLLRQQRLAREGREFSARFQSDFRIEIGPGDSIHSTFSPTAYTPKGTRTGKVMSGRFTLERPQEVKSGGSGHGVWILDDGKLTFLRTFHGGGLKMVISFARAGAGLTCTASESLVREEGVRDIVLESTIDGVPTTILSAKQISGNCRFAKQPSKPQ